LAERSDKDRASGSSGSLQVTDAVDFRWLLRLDGKAKRKEHSAKRNAEDTLADY